MAISASALRSIARSIASRTRMSRKGFFGSAEPSLARDLPAGGLLAHVDLEVEDIDRVDLGDGELGVALERRDIGGRHARDQVELARLELRDAGGIVRDFLAHDCAPTAPCRPNSRRSGRATRSPFGVQETNL